MPSFPRSYPITLAMIGAIAALTGCAATTTSGGGANTAPVAQAKLYDGQGREAGAVSLTLNAGVLNGVVDVTGLTPGSHGIHLHTTGKCDAPGFTTAGGHLNPDGKQHGLNNPQGAHQGDLPDLIVGADGVGHGTFTPRASLATVFDTDGTAFIVHAGPDDNMTDPSGNSGGRILCGVLQKTVG